jgi:hypothetical protein
MAIDQRVIDQLLKEAEDIIGGERPAEGSDQSHPGAGPASRDEGSSGLREAGPGGLVVRKLPREDRFAVVDHELITMVIGNGFPELPPCPICCGMRGHVVVQNTAAADFHHEKDEQHLEPDRHGNQKIAGQVVELDLTTGRNCT